MHVQTFTGAEGIRDASGLLHDRWFAASRIRLAGGDLIVPFASRITRRADRAIFDAELLIRNVREYHVHDTELNEIYDFNSLAFDASARRLRIEGNIPIAIDVYFDDEPTLVITTGN